MAARYFLLSIVLLAGCPSMDAGPGITLPLAYQDDVKAKSLIGVSIVPRDGQVPETHVVFRAMDEVSSSVVAGTYANDQTLTRAIKASFKATVKQSCGTNVNAAIGNASDSDIDIEWKQVLEARDDQRMYMVSTNLCSDDGHVIPAYKNQGVITTVFKTKITLHSNKSGGLAVGSTIACNRGSTGVDGSISVSISSDGHTTITSDGWNLVKIEPASESCRAWHRHHLHPMSSAEKNRLRIVAANYSRALLDTYQCHWMFGGVLIMDALCPAGQCPGGRTPLNELHRIYGMPVMQLVQQHGDTICSSIRLTMQSLGASSDVLSNCNTPSIRGWVLRHRNDQFSDITRGIEVSAQIDLLKAILPPQSRSTVADAWAQLPQGQDLFRAANQAWSQLQSQCAPGGCITNIFTGDSTNNAISTFVSWPSIRDRLFSAWLSVFSGQALASPEFNAGCRGAVMQLEGDHWSYKGTGDRTCDGGTACLSFRDPTHTDRASEWFATQIVE